MRLSVRRLRHTSKRVRGYGVDGIGKRCLNELLHVLLYYKEVSF